MTQRQRKLFHEIRLRRIQRMVQKAIHNRLKMRKAFNLINRGRATYQENWQFTD